MTHHTQMQGAAELVDGAVGSLVRKLKALDGRREVLDIARGETVRNALIELVAATRRNDPLARAARALARELGPAASGRTVRELLETLQEQARGNTQARFTPLPLGVATPIPPPPEDVTPARGQPVKAIEVDVTLDGKPTTPLAGKPTQGPWGALPPTRPVKPRRS